MWSHQSTPSSNRVHCFIRTQQRSSDFVNNDCCLSMHDPEGSFLCGEALRGFYKQGRSLGTGEGSLSPQLPTPNCRLTGGGEEQEQLGHHTCFPLHAWPRVCSGTTQASLPRGRQVWGQKERGPDVKGRQGKKNHPDPWYTPEESSQAQGQPPAPHSQPLLPTSRNRKSPEKKPIPLAIGPTPAPVTLLS